jgi:hypothetical protein
VFKDEELEQSGDLQNSSTILYGLFVLFGCSVWSSSLMLKKS